MNLSYNIKLSLDQKNQERVISTLKLYRNMFNFCSNLHFGSKKNSITELHAKVYYPLRELYPDSPSQLVIRAEQECLSTYRSIKSNKHNLSKPVKKKNLSYRLDKRLYSFPNKKSVKLTALGGSRVLAQFELYPKIQTLLDSYKVLDPLIFFRNNQLWLSVTFDVPDKVVSDQKLAVGVDLGKRNLVATSDGKLISGKEYNKHKRKVRYLKRQLQSRGTKSAKRHLKKVRRKESNFSKNYIHHIANEILNTKANIIVLEDLTKIKEKKHKYQNKNNISQVPFYLLRQIVEYKALLLGKETLLRSPAMTSQNDYRGIKKGVRQGSQYLTSDGKIFHSDINAANNIALKSKRPCLLINPVNSFRRQGVVNHPIVDTEIRLSRFCCDLQAP